MFSRALIYLHRYWPSAAVRDVWKTSLMKIWCKREAWEIWTPLELHPKSWDHGLMADVFLAFLGYSIFCLQTPLRASERLDVIFYKGIMEVCVCVHKQLCWKRWVCYARSKWGVRGIPWLLLLLKLLVCPHNLVWCQMKLLCIFRNVRKYKW